MTEVLSDIIEMLKPLDVLANEVAEVGVLVLVVLLTHNQWFF